MIDAIDTMVAIPLGLIYILILSDGWRYSKKTLQRAVCIYLLCLVAVDCAIFAIKGISVEGKAMVSIVNVLSCTAFYLSISKYKDGRMVFSFFSVCLFIFIGDTISDCVIKTEGLAHLVTKVTVFLAIAVVLYYFFRRQFLDMLREIKGEWRWLMTVPLSMCFAFAYLIMVPGPLYRNPQFQMPAILMCITVVCTYIAFYSVFRSLKRQYRIEENYHLLQTQMTALEKHADTLQRISDQTDLFRHDMRHYLQMQAACLENRNYEEAREVLESITGNFEDMLHDRQLCVYTGQPMIDAVLSFSAEKAKTVRASMDVHLSAPPEGLVNMTEFGVVLSNTLENASNACSRMPEGMERVIRIIGRQDQGQYFLEIANTYFGKILFDDEGRPTTVEKGHGFGTRSTVDFADRYHAHLTYKAENGWFRIQIII